MSADSLDAPAAQEMVRHLEQCPDCDEEWKAFQAVMFRLSTTAQPLPSAEQSRRIWASCLEEISKDVESKRRNATAETGAFGFFNFAPRWSWALLGGAAAVFGAVWALAPQDAPPGSYAPITAGFAGFQNPPALMSPLVNHHTAFAFDALNDHTGTSLVSMGSTAPAQAISISNPTTIDSSSSPSSP